MLQSFNSILMLVLIALLIGVILVIFNMNLTLSQVIDNGQGIHLTLQTIQRDQNITDVRALVILQALQNEQNVEEDKALKILQALQLEQKETEDKALVILNTVRENQKIIKAQHDDIERQVDNITTTTTATQQ